MTVQITVHLYAGFRKYANGQKSLQIEIEPGQTVEEVLRQIDVPVEQTRILFCNHQLVTTSHQLDGGETVGIFPAVGGG